jgi:hypothetical protein
VLPLLAAIAMLAGCDGSVRLPDSGWAGSSATAPAKPPRTLEERGDRNLGAVTVALRRLDPCALPRSFVANHTSMTVPIGPHSCMIVPSKTYHPGDDVVKIVVGVESGHLSRFAEEPITLAGAKAYRRTSSEGQNLSDCAVTIPVSYTRGVVVSYHGSKRGDVCPEVTKIAESVAQALRDPDSVAVDPAKRPFAAWDGCNLLGSVLGEQIRGYTLALPHAAPDPFSGCTARPAGNTGDGTKGWLVLKAAYEAWPPKIGPAGAPRKTPDGHDVFLDLDPSGCTVKWAQPSGVGITWFSSLLFSLREDSCEPALAHAAAAITLTGRQPADAGALPQRPLLYQPDEPDVAPRGACLDFATTDSEECRPARDIPAPQGAGPLLAAAATDRDIQCAAFRDAVKARFGPALSPLTWAAHCFFTEPSHTTQLLVNVNPIHPPDDYGKDTRLYTDRVTTEIGGFAAVTFYSTDRSIFDIYLSPYNDLTRKGNLHLQIESYAPRGTITTRPPALDPAQVDKAIRAMEQTATTYLR